MRRHFTLIFALFFSGLTAQVGWVGNLFPSGTANTATPGTGFDIFIDVWKGGTTDGAGQGSGISCFLHYGEVTAFGATWTNVMTVPMSYHGDSGNNDVYTYNLDVPSGLYEYTCYCDDGAGQVWNGGGNGGVEFMGVVPVNLSEFRGVKNGDLYKLHWIANNEINNEGFEVIMSGDQSNWSKAGFVEAQTGIEQNQYSFEYRSEESSLYFRLKQIDYNGSFVYSDILKLGENRINEALQFYPNPFSTELNINLEGKAPVEILSIYTQDGRIIYRRQGVLDQDELRALFLNASEGMYLVEWLINGEQGSAKLIKR